MSITSETYLLRAIQLAIETVNAGRGGPFGAVIVRDGQVLGEGQNRVLLDRDPTAHAEVVAIRTACAAVGSFALNGATLYSSCEPCPMCLAAAYWARIEQIVVAACGDDARAAGFDDVFIAKELALPHAERKLAWRQVPVEGAKLPFAMWLAKMDRVHY
jgi:guanine deaminase